MGKQLAQGDIDALFAAAGANASPSPEGTASQVLLEQYDFSRAGQISNDQMRAISSVNDLFARNLMHTLGAWLRTPFKMKLVAGEQLPFREFLRGFRPRAISARFAWSLWEPWVCLSSSWRWPHQS